MVREEDVRTGTLSVLVGCVITWERKGTGNSQSYGGQVCVRLPTASFWTQQTPVSVPTFLHTGQVTDGRRVALGTNHLSLETLPGSRRWGCISWLPGLVPGIENVSES